MTDRREQDVAELLPVLARVARGACLGVAAKGTGLDGVQLLELALRDDGFAAALLVAQNERAHREHLDVLAELQGIGAAVAEVAANA